MQDISFYFKPVEVIGTLTEEGSIFMNSEIHTDGSFPDVEKNSIAVFSVPEYRRSSLNDENETYGFRSELYQLNVGDAWNRKIYDLGTILPGETIEDTYYAVSKVVSELVKINVIPVIIGGGHDLTLACYKGFESLEQTVNICAIDSKLDIGEPTEDITADGFVSHLLMQRPCYLFNYANIGMQRPKVKSKEIELFEKLYFDITRLGAFNDDFKRAEPHLRNADIISIDFSSIKNGDTDKLKYMNPNGFRSDQICQISKYAGMSDKLNCFGVFEIDHTHNRSTNTLLAEMIWYFIDGVNARLGDFPMGSKKNYKKFFVHLEGFKDDLVFYKSNKSERWWMEVSYPAGEGQKYERHHMIPCDHDDYVAATENNIPDLWWKTLQKLS